MPYANEHAARIKSPDIFDLNTFRRTSGGKAVLPGSGMITLPKTIDIIWGKLKTANKPSDQPIVQALRFPTKNWKADDAKKWLTDNKVKYISFEPASTNSFYAEDDPNPYLEMEQEAKPLLLYAPIYDFVAEQFVDKMNEISNDQDIEIWMNCPGGRVFAGWSIIGPLVKREGKKKLCIFGHAMSMAVYIALFCDNVEALEVTQFMIHRADGYIETPEDQLLLDNINKDLRKQMESRLNMDVFEEICGCTMDDIFKGDQRKDIMLTAKQAKKLGLINSIKKLTPKEVQAYTEHFVAFADFGTQRSEPTQRSEYQYEQNNNNHNNNKKMTLAEFLAQHPELAAQIKNDVIKAERDRVGSFLAFLDVDKEYVVKAIKEGTEFSSVVMAEMTVKLTAHVAKTNIEADGSTTPRPVTPKVDDPKSPEALQVEAEVKQVEDGTKNYVKNYKF